LTENRCPECGEAFDIEQLVARQTQPDQPILSRPSCKGALKAVFLCSLLNPSRIGQELPGHPDNSEAIFYSMTMKYLGAILLLLVVHIGHSPQNPFFLVASAIIVVMATEHTIAWLLARSVVPRSGPLSTDRFGFWLNLCRCFSGYFVLSSLASFVLSPFARLGLWGPMVAFTSLMLWWWCSLGLAIWTRSMPSRGRVVTILLIPLIGLAYILIGTTGYMAGGELYR
jgi:hypothetical protein